MWFCRLLEPGPESHQIDTPGYDFVDFRSQGQKVLKSLLQAMILLTSGARARKSSNRCSRMWFYISENHEKPLFCLLKTWFLWMCDFWTNTLDLRESWKTIVLLKKSMVFVNVQFLNLLVKTRKGCFNYTKQPVTIHSTSENHWFAK